MTKGNGGLVKQSGIVASKNNVSNYTIGALTNEEVEKIVASFIEYQEKIPAPSKGYKRGIPENLRYQIPSLQTKAEKEKKMWKKFNSLKIEEQNLLWNTAVQTYIGHEAKKDLDKNSDTKESPNQNYYYDAKSDPRTKDEIGEEIFGKETYQEIKNEESQKRMLADSTNRILASSTTIQKLNPLLYSNPTIPSTLISNRLNSYTTSQGSITAKIPDPTNLSGLTGGIYGISSGSNNNRPLFVNSATINYQITASGASRYAAFINVSLRNHANLVALNVALKKEIDTSALTNPTDITQLNSDFDTTLGSPTGLGQFKITNDDTLDTATDISSSNAKIAKFIQSENEKIATEIAENYATITSLQSEAEIRNLLDQVSTGTSDLIDTTTYQKLEESIIALDSVNKLYSKIIPLAKQNSVTQQKLLDSVNALKAIAKTISDANANKALTANIISTDWDLTSQTTAINAALNDFQSGASDFYQEYKDSKIITPSPLKVDYNPVTGKSDVKLVDGQIFSGITTDGIPVPTKVDYDPLTGKSTVHATGNVDTQNILTDGIPVPTKVDYDPLTGKSTVHATGNVDTQNILTDGIPVPTKVEYNPVTKKSTVHSTGNFDVTDITTVNIPENFFDFEKGITTTLFPNGTNVISNLKDQTITFEDLDGKKEVYNFEKIQSEGKEVISKTNTQKILGSVGAQVAGSLQVELLVGILMLLAKFKCVNASSEKIEEMLKSKAFHMMKFIISFAAVAGNVAHYKYDGTQITDLFQNLEGSTADGLVSRVEFLDKDKDNYKTLNKFAFAIATLVLSCGAKALTNYLTDQEQELDIVIPAQLMAFICSDIERTVKLVDLLKCCNRRQQNDHGNNHDEDRPGQGIGGLRVMTRGHVAGDRTTGDERRDLRNETINQDITIITDLEGETSKDELNPPRNLGIPYIREKINTLSKIAPYNPHQKKNNVTFRPSIDQRHEVPYDPLKGARSYVRDCREAKQDQHPNDLFFESLLEHNIKEPFKAMKVLLDTYKSDKVEKREVSLIQSDDRILENLSKIKILSDYSQGKVDQPLTKTNLKLRNEGWFDETKKFISDNSNGEGDKKNLLKELIAEYKYRILEQITEANLEVIDKIKSGIESLEKEYKKPSTTIERSLSPERKLQTTTGQKDKTPY